MNTNPTLYSYVVDHDTGYAPNPYRGNCILSHCKFDKKGKRKNLLECVKEGDWIVGTGGSSPRTAPGDHIVYAMRVEQKLPIEKLKSDRRFRAKAEEYPVSLELPSSVHGEWFVVSFADFFYFGSAAKPIPPSLRDFRLSGGKLPETLKAHRGFKCSFSAEFVQAFLRWIRRYRPGMAGDPWATANASEVTNSTKACRTNPEIRKGGRSC